METNYKEIFDQEFDISEPSIGHFDRFQKKLHSSQKRKSNKWKWISIAASVVILIGLWTSNFETSNQMDLADISPQMEETQDYFMIAIRDEIEKINLQKNDGNIKLIDDTLIRLNQLEIDYQKLTIELMESDEDKRVIFAMISNYQQRVEILKNLLKQIESIKKIKSKEYEEFS